MAAEIKVERLVNEHGSDYGLEVVAVAGTYEEGYQALVEKFGEERLQGSSDVWDQFRWAVETPETRSALAEAEKAAFPGEPIG